jgi:inorganic pyrophosphatase
MQRVERQPSRVVAVIEVPKGGLVKRRSDGSIDFVTPIPSPWNYGYVPGTESGDGDPLDAIVLGPRLAKGVAVEREVVAEVDFLDEGQPDPKLVLAERALSAFDQKRIVLFFRIYERAKRVLARSRGRRGEIRFRGLTLR